MAEPVPRVPQISKKVEKSEHIRIGGMNDPIDEPETRPSFPLKTNNILEVSNRRSKSRKRYEEVSDSESGYGQNLFNLNDQKKQESNQNLNLFNGRGMISRDQK